MEFYTLDGYLRRTKVFDKYESLIWTERFADNGDFELIIESNASILNDLAKGTWVAIRDSPRVMTIKTLEDKIDTDGRKILSVKGEEIGDILKDRVARNTMSDTVSETSWDISQPPLTVINMMFSHICISGALSANDILPMVSMGRIYYPADTNPAPGIIAFSTQLDSLYNAIKTVCDQNDVGYRFIRNGDASSLYFDAYVGCDRTSGQSDFPPVIFSEEFDNFFDYDKLTSIDGVKNVAYIFSDLGYGIQGPTEADTTASSVVGWARKVIAVTYPGSIDPDKVESLTEALGWSTLKPLLNGVDILDGTLNNPNLTYGVDYNVGDIVELRAHDGTISERRITEHVYVSDQSGDRSYPTLSST